MTRLTGSRLALVLIAQCFALFARSQNPTLNIHPSWEQKEPADAKTKKEIKLAIVVVQEWWKAHKDGFKKCRMRPVSEDWRRLGPSFFTDPKSKGIAFSAWNADHSDYWWAVRENRDLGPWKITAPQEDGFTFEWTIGVDLEGNTADLVEVRLVCPCKVMM